MARTAGSIGSETARKVLNASLKLISKEGYAAVSMRQIAGEVGLNAGAIYNHFPTKQAILHQLMISHLSGLLDALDGQPEPTEPAAALEAFARFHIRYHIDKPEEVFIAYMELRNLEPEPYREVMARRQKYERPLRTILRRGMASGDFEIPDAPVAAMAIISMLTGVNTWFRYGGRLSVEEIEKIYVNMILSVAGISDRGRPDMEWKETA